jgi:glycosyltransferase involved in cell wall biosynthesis
VASGVANQVERLLAVSWSFPPLLSPRSLQVGRLLDELTRLNWKVDVLTVDPDSIEGSNIDPQIEQLYNGSVYVHQLPDTPLRMFKIALGKLMPSFRPLPDPESGWVKRTIAKGKKLLDQNKYYGIASFAQPWSSHLVALELQAISGLRWIAHFSDPWADNPYYAGLSTKQLQRMNKLEALVVEHADSLVFTNQQTARAFKAKYKKGIEQKIAVIPHGYDQRLISKSSSGPRRERLQFAYTGSLYGRRTPEPLIRGVSLLPDPSRVNVIFAGPVKNVGVYQELAERLGLTHSIKFIGNQSYQESLNLAAEAEVLLLIDAPSDQESPFLPSKLVDYLMFKKPILGITPNTGATADLLKRLKCWQVNADDIEGIAKTLTKIITQWEEGELSISPDFDEISREYQIDHIAEKFVKVLQPLPTRADLTEVKQ